MQESVQSEIPIIIVDKEGILGEEICKRLNKEAKIVFVSSKEITGENITFIPFRKKIPLIPGITYSFIFVILDSYLLKKELLFEIAKKAKEDEAKFVVVSSIFNKNNELFEELKDIYSKTKIALLGEVFGKNLPQNYSLVNQILNIVKRDQKIKISHKGLLKIYPLYLKDAIEEIIKASFSNNKIFYLFSNPLTELSFVRIIKKIEPLVKIDFEEKKEDSEDKERNADIPEGGLHVLLNYNLQSKIKETLEGTEVKNKELGVKNRESKRKKKEQRKLFIVFFLLITVFLMPFLASLAFLIYGAWQTENAFSFIEQSELNRAKNSSLLAKNSFSLAQASYGLSIIKSERIYKKIQKGQKASDIFYQGILAYEKIMQGEFSQGSFLLKETVSNLSFLKKEGLSPNEKNMLKKFEPSLIFLGNLIDAAPEFLGFNGKRKYLVLFQNNMELRPGGGFIGSFGLLTLEKGEILDFSIHDVYSADGQLKGHVEPPFAIRRYLPLVHWYLRDSNFSPDFKTNAQKAAFFLKNESKEEVGGVIAVDISFVKNLLLATGPLYVSDFDENVNFDNFYILTQSHSERNFFPGSTQKRDFLRSLFNTLKTQLRENKVSHLKSLSIVQEAIREKHLLFYSENKDIQKIFQVNKMSSTLSDEREKEDSVNDFLGVSEANLGVNKANYFVKRKVDHKVKLEGKDLLGKVTISYMNLSETWPGGDYKNYLQLILPKNAELLSIIIDGKEQKTTKAIIDPLIYEAKNFKPPKELEAEEREEEDKTIFGFLVMIPRGDLRKVEVSYRVSGMIRNDLSAFSYNLRVFKQPGTEKYPFSFSLDPTDFKILKGQNSFETKLNSDLDLVFKLAKK